MQILLFAACAMATFFSVLFFIKCANKFNLLDHPGKVKTHLISTPRGAGVFIVPIVAIFYIFYSKFTFGLVDDKVLILSLTLIIMSLLFFIEDICGLPILIRLLLQSLAIGVGMFLLRSDISNDILTFIPNWIKFPMIFFGWLWFNNLYNFMDGINGITGCQTIFMSLAMIFCISFFQDFKKDNQAQSAYQVSVSGSDLKKTTISSGLQADAGLLVGLVIGLSMFLHFNRTPSRVFIGDSGSVSLGFITGYLLIRFGIDFGIIPALIISLYYIMDSGVTILLRLKNKEKIWLPHNKHFFQYAKRSGMSDNKICLAISALNTLFLFPLSIITIYFRLNPIIIIIAFCVSLCIVLCLMFYFYRIYVENSNSFS